MSMHPCFSDSGDPGAAGAPGVQEPDGMGCDL